MGNSSAFVNKVHLEDACLVNFSFCKIRYYLNVMLLTPICFSLNIVDLKVL